MERRVHSVQLLQVHQSVLEEEVEVGVAFLVELVVNFACC